MKIKFALILLVSVFALSIKNLKAQAGPPTVANLQQSQNFTPAQLRAAERLFDTSGLMNNIQKLIANFIQTQAQQIPADKRTACINVMQKFFTKYLAKDSLKKVFVPLYAAAYSETELNQIADFLSSPAGQVMTAKQPELIKQGMLWGQQMAQEHTAELQAMIKEAMGEK